MTFIDHCGKTDFRALSTIFAWVRCLGDAKHLKNQDYVCLGNFFANAMQTCFVMLNMFEHI